MVLARQALEARDVGVDERELLAGLGEAPRDVRAERAAGPGDDDAHAGDLVSGRELALQLQVEHRQRELVGLDEVDPRLRVGLVAERPLRRAVHFDAVVGGTYVATSSCAAIQCATFERSMPAR